MKKNRVYKYCFVIFLITFFCCIFFIRNFYNSKERQKDGDELFSGENYTIEKGVLRIGTEYGYPPFEYLDSDGKTLIGFDVDLWNELCKRLGLKPKVYDTQWIGLFSSLESNRYDCVISAVTITPNRKEKFLITTPYVQNAQSFVVRKDFTKMLDGPEKMEGLKVAFQSETVSDYYISSLVEKGLKANFFKYDKLMDAFVDLRFGRVDVVVAESVSSKNIVKNETAFRIDFVGEPDAFFGILVNRNNEILFSKIQETLNQMYEDGFMSSIEEKWLE